MSKGQLPIDLAIVIIFLLAFGIALFFVVKIYTALNVNIQAAPEITADSKAIGQNASASYGSLWDYLMVFAYGLLWVFLLISSYFVETHPMFMIVSIIIFIPVFIVIMIVGNTYQSVANNVAMAAESSAFPLSLWLYSHILELSIFEALTCMIALFARGRTSGVGV